MGTVTSLFARKVAAAVGDSVDREALLRSVGLEQDGKTNPAHMLADAEYYAFLERAAKADPEGITLPLRVGATMRCDEYGAFGLAWKSATTLRGSYDRAERYARVLTSVSTYEVEPAADGAFMHLHREGERRLGLRLSNESTMASIVAISREVASVPFRPLAAYFKHDAPGTLAYHEAYFGCPVYFGANRDALLVSGETLRTPNRLGDPAIVRFFDTHLATELEKMDDDAPLDRQVRDLVTTSLSEGIPPVGDVALQLGMSARTLQRRLSDQGFSFQVLIDDARRQLARRLLEQTDFSLIEIAFMTGFSGQSAFTRAFKRWAGQTPRSYRLSARDAPP